jgi:hypothetical protein
MGINEGLFMGPNYLVQRKIKEVQYSTHWGTYITSWIWIWHIHTSSTDLLKQCLTLPKEFDILSTGQAEKLISKSRYQNDEHGEKSGKMLAHQLRQRTANQTIPEINDELCNKCIDHLVINSCFQTFTQNATLFDTFFENLDIRTVEPDIAAELEEQFSVE